MSARITHRTRLVYAGLICLLLLTFGWQGVEHSRVRRNARAELINRARDISTTLGVVIRSQRRFGWLLFKEGLESAFNSLIKKGDLIAIALLNDDEEIVASAGTPIELELKKLAPRSEYWGKHTVALMNPVDLGTSMGTNVDAEPDSPRATIVLPSFGTNRPPAPPPRHRDSERDADDNSRGDGVEPRDDDRDDTPPRGRRRRGEGRFPFGRPWWMSEEEYRELVQKQGVHSFVLVLSTDSMRSVLVQDLWARGLI